MTADRHAAFPAGGTARGRIRGRAVVASVLALATAPAAPASEPGLPPDFDRSARRLGGSSATEYWDITARFDSGDQLFSRFAITNQGPGKQTAFALHHLVTPGGRAHDFRNGRRAGRWKLSADGLRLKIGSSVLDLRGPLQKFEMDSNKQGVKIHLEIPIGTVATHAEGVGPRGYRSDLLELGAPVEGTIWIEGLEAPRPVRGRAAVTHSWMKSEEHALSQRRIELFSLAGDLALYVSDLTTPSGERFSWVAAWDAERGALETGPARIALRGRAEGSEDKYALPQSICIRDSRLEARALVDRILLENDPRGAIPLALRFLFLSGSRPRRTWADATFDVTFAPDPTLPPIQQQGSGVAAVAFLNPLEPSSKERAAESAAGVPCESAY